VVLTLVALFALAVWVVTATQRTAAIAIAMDAVLVPLGVMATVIVVIRLSSLPDLGPHVGRAVGVYLALAGALGISVGAWLAMRNERSPMQPLPEVERVPPPEPAQ
jgi:hypothetical protein